jgi:hypothetical protein
LALVVTVAAFPPILKLATGVVDVTTNGAVPVATVEVNCPVTLKLVPVAAPITGVTKVGDVARTATPVPVSSDKAVAKSAEVNDPKDVVFPMDVTAPDKFALVTTVVAFPTLVTIPVKFALVAFAVVTAVVTAEVTNSVVAT